MSRSAKILIGILSILPILAVAVLFITIFTSFVSNWGAPDSEPSILFKNFNLFFLAAGGLSLLSIGLLVYFILHVAKNKKMDSTERVIWVLVFILGGIIGYPIYWYMKIWKEDL